MEGQGLICPTDGGYLLWGHSPSCLQWALAAAGRGPPLWGKAIDEVGAQGEGQGLDTAGGTFGDGGSGGQVSCWT